MGHISDKLWRKSAEQNIPLAGMFELLPLCNLNCKMCYIRQSMAEVNQQGGLMPAEKWIELGQQASEAGTVFLLLTGGEPFLRKDFKEIYESLHELGLQLSINTNGTLIDEDTAQWLAKFPPLRVNITIYGASSESYEKLCGDGSAYDKVMRATSILKRYGIRIKLNTSVTPENIHEFEKIIEFAKSNDLPLQVAPYMFPPIRRDENMIGQNHRLPPREAGRIRVLADWLQKDRDWFIGQALSFSRFVPLSDPRMSTLTESKPQSMFCRAGVCSFWLDWQGNLSNCGMYPSVNYSLNDYSFGDAWRKVVEDTSKIVYNSVCTGCPNSVLCHSCIAMAYNESGSPDGRPEYLCEMNDASAYYYGEYLRKLQDEGLKIPDNIEQLLKKTDSRF